MFPLFARNRVPLSRAWGARLLIAAMLLAAFWYPSGQARAQESFAFDVMFGPIAVARVSGAARETSESYAVGAAIRATRLASAFARVDFLLNAEGVFGSPELVATAYREQIDTGERQSSVDMVWRGDVPVIRRGEPGTSNPVPPSRARGAIDPLSAMYRLARPRPEAELCGWSVPVYDGARYSEVRVGSPRAEGDEITCEAVLERLEGFPPEDLAENPRFTFTARFEPQGDLWALTEVSTATIYGTVRILRRD